MGRGGGGIRQGMDKEGGGKKGKRKKESPDLRFESRISHLVDQCFNH